MCESDGESLERSADRFTTKISGQRTDLVPDRLRRRLRRRCDRGLESMSGTDRVPKHLGPGGDRLGTGDASEAGASPSEKVGRRPSQDNACDRSNRPTRQKEQQQTTCDRAGPPVA